MLKITKLPSGLKIATYKIDRKAAAISFSFKGGNRNETPTELGTAHFLEHILLKGSKKYPSPKLVKESVQSLGGNIGGVTDNEQTVFHSRILLENIDQPLDTLTDIIQFPLLDPVIIEREKEIIKEEYNRYNNNFERRAFQFGSELLWRGHPLGKPIDIWALDNLVNITPHSIKEFMSKHYIFDNCVVMIVGNVDHEEWVEKVSNKFDSISNKGAEISPVLKKLPGIQFKGEVRDTKQVNLNVSFYAPGFQNEDRFAVRIANSIWDLRIINNLRYEHGLSYSPGTSFNPYQELGAWRVSGEFKSGSLKESTGEILKEAKLLSSSIPTEQELVSAKARVKSGLVFSSESVLSIRDNYAEKILLDIKPLEMEEVINHYEKVSVEDVKRVAKIYLTDDFKVSAVGPVADINELEKLYGKSS